jgi:SAM-dependent methyltransferase
MLLTNDIILLNKFREWYSSEVAEGSDNFDKFRYHLENQLQGWHLSGKCVLEVGCGKGAVSLYLALFSGVQQVIALDEAAGEGAPVGVNQVLRDAAALFGVNNLTVVDADIMNNGFSDGAFDFIIANNALHHVNESGLISKVPSVRAAYVRIFKELKRLLAAKGILSIYEYSRLSFWRWSPLKFKWKQIDWELHPTRAEWLSVIRESGFKLRSCKYGVPYRLRHMHVLLTNPIAQFTLFPSFVIAVEK